MKRIEVVGKIFIMKIIFILTLVFIITNFSNAVFSSEVDIIPIGFKRFHFRYHPKATFYNNKAILCTYEKLVILDISDVNNIKVNYDGKLGLSHGTCQAVVTDDKYLYFFTDFPGGDGSCFSNLVIYDISNLSQKNDPITEKLLKTIVDCAYLEKDRIVLLDEDPCSENSTGIKLLNISNINQPVFIPNETYQIVEYFKYYNNMVYGRGYINGGNEIKQGILTIKIENDKINMIDNIILDEHVARIPHIDVDENYIYLVKSSHIFDQILLIYKIKSNGAPGELIKQIIAKNTILFMKKIGENLITLDDSGNIKIINIPSFRVEKVNQLIDINHDNNSFYEYKGVFYHIYSSEGNDDCMVDIYYIKQ